MTTNLKLFVVEYSITENATHVRTLSNMIANNRSNLARGLPKDYVPIGLFRDRQAADSFVIDFRLECDKEAQLALGSRNWHRIREIIEGLLPRDLNDLDSTPK